MPQYDTSSLFENTIDSSKSFSISEVWIIVSILLAVIGGIFFFTTYFGHDRDGQYTGYKKLLYDFFNFKLTIIEPIFRVCYLIIAIAITLSSFSLITINFFRFIAVLVFGNIIARLGFELLLLILKLFKDVSEINVKLDDTTKSTKSILLNKRKKEDSEEKVDVV